MYGKADRMTDAPQAHRSLLRKLDSIGLQRPDIVLMSPYMVYLLLMTLVSIVPPELEWAAILIRGVGALAVVAMFWRHMPDWGRPWFWLAIPAGIFAAWGWVAGQYWGDSLGLPGRLPGFPGEKTVVDPHDVLGASDLFRVTAILRIVVACTAVPVVEELFWRAFLLRALIQWDRFDQIPLGRFTWFSFLGTSLLSTLQHPDNWFVSILCWFFFNALFYWTRSVWCLIVVHAVTNLALYDYVVRNGDWSFW